MPSLFPLASVYFGIKYFLAFSLYEKLAMGNDRFQRLENGWKPLTVAENELRETALVKSRSSNSKSSSVLKK
jgi:hypothetical protein